MLKFAICNSNFQKVLAVPFWELQNKEYERVSGKRQFGRFIRKVLSFVYYCISKQPLVVCKNENYSDTFFIRAHSRSDLDVHSEMYESAISNISICVMTRKIRRVDFTTLPKVVVILFVARKSIARVYKEKNVKVWQKEGINIFFSLLYALADCIKLLPHVIASKKVISFQEMVPVENLICQVANALGKTTFGLQHALGAYSDVGSYESRYSRIHYEPSVCKNVLVWGQYTKQCFEKFVKTNVFLIGKPSLPEIERFVEGVTFIFEADDDVNSKLLDFSHQIEALGYPVSRWFRPGHELVNKFGAVRLGPLRKTIIGWRSSLLVELGFLGGDVFVISESVFATSLPEELVVNSVKQIKSKLLCPKKYPHEIWRQFICCSGNDSINQFRFRIAAQ